MNFYQNINPFIEYLFSIRKLKDYLSIDLLIPNKWSLPKSLAENTEIVPFSSESTETKGISFVCKLDENSVSTTISKIIKVINLNKEKELKELLFKETIDTLKKTFEKNDLDTLKRLYIDFASETEDTSNLEDYDTGESETFEMA